MENFQLSLKYSPVTNITSVFLVWLAPPSDATPGRIQSLISSLLGQFKICTHPLLLPISIVERNINICWLDCQTMIDELNILQDEINRLGTDPEQISQNDLIGPDFTSVTRGLNFTAGLSTRVMFCLKGFASSFVVFEELGRLLGSGDMGGLDKERFLAGQDLIFKKADYLRGTMETNLLLGDTVEKRIEMYRQLVCTYNLLCSVNDFPISSNETR